MTAKWRMLIVRISRKLWFRATMYGSLGVFSALIGAVAKPLLPTGIATKIGAAAVGNILGILAASMLAVTTFSLSTMVAAYAAASSSATPRASRLLIEDSSAQRALSTFIGAFLFSIVGLIALSTGIYGDGGRLILFAATVLIIVMIVVTLLRWIDYLSRLGRVGETIDRVELAAREAMRELARAPLMHAADYTLAPVDSLPIESATVGYVSFVDVEDLQEIAKANDLKVWVEVCAGHFVAPGRPVLKISRAVDARVAKRLLSSVSVGDTRDYAQDPRFGLIVLTEIAQRALSPAINDPGTAIDIIGTVTRLLCGWSAARQRAEPEKVLHDRVFVKPLGEEDFFEDVFAPLSHDGASLLQVSIRLQKSLAILGQLGYTPFHGPAAYYASRSLQFTQTTIQLAEDRQRLADIAAWRLTSA
jgi:uncharacterized membrane protein